MKKVLFAATVVRLHINLFHTPFLKWFKDEGWQVDVAARNDYSNPQDCLIPYCDNFHDIPFERSPIKKNNFEAYKQLKELLERERYDIIHCHTPMGSVITRLAAETAKKCGTKVIYTAHGFHFYKGAPLANWLLYYPVEKLLSARTDMLITINQEDYRRARHFHARDVAYIPGIGIDLSKFKISDQRDTVRGELGLTPQDVFAVSVGELIPRKNHTTLIQAVQQLHSKKFHLFICGDGVQHQMLAQEIKKHGLEDQVHLLGFRSDIYRLCAAADLFLFASRQEGLPVAVMEAMACGLPIICSDIRGNRDLVDAEKGGILVPSNDVNGFVDAIQKCLRQPEVLKEMKNHNLNKIKKFSTEEVVDRMSKIYALVIRR